MSHFYNPPSPFVGGRQPLAPGPKFTPSGKTPDNPPGRGGRIPPDLMRNFHWREPPSGGVAFVATVTPDNPPFAGGARVSNEILQRWIPLPPDEVLYRELVQPAPDNPPFNGGSRVMSEILQRWIPPAPDVVYPAKFTAGAVLPDNPQFSGGARVSREVLNAWIPPAPDVVYRTLLNPGTPAYVPSNPPFAGGARVSTEILSRWTPAPPDAVARPKFTPSTPVTSDNPPFNGGARVRGEVLSRWIITPVDGVYRTKLTSGFVLGSGPTGTLSITEQNDTPTRRISDVLQPYVPKRYPSIPAGVDRHLRDELNSVSTSFNDLLKYVKQQDARLAALGG